MGGSAINVKGTATKGLANLTAASASINSSDLPVAHPPGTKPVELKDLHLNLKAKYPLKEGAAPLDLAEIPNLGLTVALGSSRIEVKGTVLGGLAKITANAKLVNTSDVPFTLPLKKPVEIKDLQLAAEMNGQDVRLTTLALQLFGGLLRAQGTLSLGTTAPPFSGTASLQGLQLGPALQSGGHGPGVHEWHGHCRSDTQRARGLPILTWSRPSPAPAMSPCGTAESKGSISYSKPRCCSRWSACNWTTSKPRHSPLSKATSS
jgi:hypothetical protein